MTGSVSQFNFIHIFGYKANPLIKHYALSMRIAMDPLISVKNATYTKISNMTTVSNLSLTVPMS